MTSYDSQMVPPADDGEDIVLFYPHIPAKAIDYIGRTLATRWIGQGPQVESFERQFASAFTSPHQSLAVGSGTDALHLAYLLADIGPGDEVITPVFTCVATTMPLLYIGATIRFADVQPHSLNIDPRHVASLISERTKAIVAVHYGGLPCDMDELREIARQWNIPVIEDASHAVGARYHGAAVGSISEFTTFSFQAIKQITTGDGGMLSIKDAGLVETAKRLRWFGIDRSASQLGVWENNITEIGYKYQMTDISAAMGLAALEEFEENAALRKSLFLAYERSLAGIPGVRFVGGGCADRVHAAWMCTVLAEGRSGLQEKLSEHHIESKQVHYRNDRYSIFGGRQHTLPAMDAVEEKYLVLPLHTHMTLAHVERICSVLRSGW